MSVPIWEIGKNKTPFLTELGRTQAINNLLEIYIRFACYEIDLFFIFGTLLGAVRDGDFIHTDDDIDLGGFYRDRDKYPLQELRELGYYIPVEGMPSHDIVLTKDGIKIEIWLFEEVGEEYCYDPKECPSYNFSKDSLDNLGFVIFKGIKFKTPQDPEEFLNRAYGKNWRIPDKNRHGVL